MSGQYDLFAVEYWDRGVEEAQGAHYVATYSTIHPVQTIPTITLVLVFSTCLLHQSLSLSLLSTRSVNLSFSTCLSISSLGFTSYSPIWLSDFFTCLSIGFSAFLSDYFAACEILSSEQSTYD